MVTMEASAALEGPRGEGRKVKLSVFSEECCISRLFGCILEQCGGIVRM